MYLNIQNLLNVSKCFKNFSKRLAKHFKNTLDIKAAHILIITHLRFVVKISKYYIKYGILISDLIQEGSLGLMKAIKKFNPEKNIRLVTFAIHWIKSEIHEYILKQLKINQHLIKQRPPAAAAPRGRRRRRRLVVV